jgi:hypothetical protein
MATLDFAWLMYFTSVFGFVFVWVFLFALFTKTKLLGENNFINSIIALVFALVFISFTPGVSYLIQTVMPWFVILIVSLFFLMMIVAFSQKEMDKFMKPWLAWVFIGLMVLIFLFSAIKIFNPQLAPYLPGASDAGGDPTLIALKNIVYSQEFLGAVLIVIIVVVLWRMLVKGK